MLKIITDSASDLPTAIQERFHLFVIPTPVVIDGIDYLDGKTISPEEFYEIQSAGQKEIHTYHINPDMFMKAFLPYAQRGDSVLYLCFSTGIAGTFNAANIAKQTLLEQYPDFDLTIFDTRCASAGFGLLVYYLCLLYHSGADKQTLLEAAKFYRTHIRHIFTVETLEYLIKGGRLSPLKGNMAKALNIKPIITVDEAGSLKVYKLAHGRKKSLRALTDFLMEHGDSIEQQKIAICHGAAYEAVETILDLAGNRISDALISQVGCAIGAHTGKGIVGICFLDAKDPYLPVYAQKPIL